jgi:hypothetical protein
MPDQRRESDPFMLQVSRELGGLQSAVEEGAKSREAIWNELKSHTIETRNSMTKIADTLQGLAHKFDVIDHLKVLQQDHDQRIDTLETKEEIRQEEQKKKKWTLAGLVAGATFAGGTTGTYLSKVLSFFNAPPPH